MELVGTVLLAVSARTVEQRDVARHLLARRAARQDAKEHRERLQVGNHFLHSHDGDVAAGQGRRQARVPLVLDDGDRARLGDREVRAGDPDISLEKLRAQQPARLLRELLTLRLSLGVVLLLEQIRDLLLGLVNRRHNDVGGGVSSDLDDVLAQIRLDRLDSRRNEGVVQADLLVGHGLALDGDAPAPFGDDREHDLLRLRGIARPVHHAATCLDARREPIEV